MSNVHRSIAEGLIHNCIEMWSSDKGLIDIFAKQIMSFCRLFSMSRSSYTIHSSYPMLAYAIRPQSRQSNTLSIDFAHSFGLSNGKVKRLFAKFKRNESHNMTPDHDPAIQNANAMPSTASHCLPLVNASKIISFMRRLCASTLCALANCMYAIRIN